MVQNEVRIYIVVNSGVTNDQPGNRALYGTPSHCAKGIKGYPPTSGGATIKVEGSKDEGCSKDHHCAKCSNVHGTVHVNGWEGQESDFQLDLSNTYKGSDKLLIYSSVENKYWLELHYKDLKSSNIRADFMTKQALYGVSGLSSTNPVSAFQQAIVGGVEPPGGLIRHTSPGYCMDSANINEKIYRVGDDTETCDTIMSIKAFKDIYKNAANKIRLEQKFCDDNPTSNNCSCYNITKKDVDTYCHKNPTNPGCDEYMTNLKPLEAADITGAWTGGAACLAPNACNGDVFQPANPPKECKIDLEICKQVINIGKAAAGETIYNTCKQEMSDESDDDWPPGWFPTWMPPYSSTTYIGLGSLTLVLVILLVVFLYRAI
tara:strand:+ start:987 stop:2111 length:1125 start_codon:yes stop_codon:yes gene_type:complete